MRLHIHEWGEPGAPRVVCLHGVSAHGRRFRRLAEERLARRYHVLAPDLRGHGRSDWEPPWTIATHVADVLETVGAEPAVWIGHSFGGRLVLELAARRPELVERAVLLDPAIQFLPHIGFDLACHELKGVSFATEDEAVAARLETGPGIPREFLEEEMREHLEPGRDGRLRYRYCRPAVVSAYGEMCTEPPPAIDSLPKRRWPPGGANRPGAYEMNADILRMGGVVDGRHEAGAVPIGISVLKVRAQRAAGRPAAKRLTNPAF